MITPFLHLGNLNDPSDNIRRAYTAPHLVKFLREADLILVQTPTEQAAVERLGIQADRIVLQGLGVDPTECTGGDRDSARRDWGVQPGEFVIGHLANLSMEKGSVDLLAAAEMAQQAGCQIRVILAGHEMPSFRQFWKWSGPNDWIVRLGVLTDQQRRDFFAGVDLFVLPSISDSFGLVFLEAWANAVPVIGYRAGGVVDVIRHEQDGLLVRCGDLNELTKAIRRMSANELERLAWGRAGQERLPRDFRWEDKLRVAREAITEWPQNIEWPREGTKRHEK